MLLGQKENVLLKRKQKKFTFEISAPQARQVSLTGDFFAWDPLGIPMTKEKNGIWKTEVSLTSGRYEYKFIVDGEWCTDPANTQTVSNGYGSLNSVKQLTV